MKELFMRIRDFGVVPVIVINDAKDAIALADAFIAGGLPCLEITYRTAAAEEAIRRIAAGRPSVLVGAGTVLTPSQVDGAAAAGAKFIVSPGFNPAVVSRCMELGVPVLPGCCGPTDIETAMGFGLDTVKFFPAEQSGGLEFIKAVSAPYPNMRFVPTGGINENNLGDYLAFNKILACGGSWLAPAGLIADGDFDGITRICRRTVMGVLGFELEYISAGARGGEETPPAVNRLESLFGRAGRAVRSVPGEKKHIAFSANDTARALAFLEREGVRIVAGSEEYDKNGGLESVYLNMETGGFALRLVSGKRIGR